MQTHTERKEHTEMEEHTETETETEGHTEDGDDDDEASTSTENVREEPNLNSTFALRRKVAKRTLPWDLAVNDLELVSPQQAEEIRATMRPRLEEPSSASMDEAATKISSPDTAVSLPDPAPDDDDDDDHADANPVKDTQEKEYWTPEEDAKLYSAVTNTSKKKMKNGKENRTDWAAVAALVPNRRKSQCLSRWRYHIAPIIDRAKRRTGSKWSKDEDAKLKDAVQTYGGKNWAAIAALVPSRKKQQCQSRWYQVLNPSIVKRTGKRVEDKDTKLKDAVPIGDQGLSARADLPHGKIDPSVNCTGHKDTHEDHKQAFPVNPQPSDIMLGRGRSFLSHPGNQRMDMVVSMNTVRYLKAVKRNEKTLITQEIVQITKGIGSAPGRFLQHDPKAGGWLEVDDEAARVKVSHAMRYRVKCFANARGKGDAAIRADLGCDVLPTRDQGEFSTESQPPSNQVEDAMCCSISTGQSPQDLTCATSTAPFMKQGQLLTKPSSEGIHACPISPPTPSTFTTQREPMSLVEYIRANTQER
jgi:hypothetical protein